jgi:hypothetical protein
LSKKIENRLQEDGNFEAFSSSEINKMEMIKHQQKQRWWHTERGGG